MKKAAFLILLLVVPATAQETRLKVPYSRHVLDNGLNVILHVDRTLPMVSVNIYYNVGSASERPGRTGFAHLFEHLMFEGSKNVPEGKFDEWLEEVGGDNNGSTNTDRTNYWITLPANALERALFLDSDRLGYLVDAMTQEKLDGQRSVVKNERRQSYENRPYGMSWIRLNEELYPEGHPYRWPVIGSMEDLTAASFEDVVEFFRTYYIPNNASLVVAGAIDTAVALQAVKKWFGGITAGKPVPPMDPPAAFLSAEKRIVLEDKVSLPRLTMAWHTPAVFAPGDAEMDLLASLLAGGKNSRLYKKLVHELQIAQDVSAYQGSRALGSSFLITATARAGIGLSELEHVIQSEIDRLRAEAPSERELKRAVNQNEASFLSSLQRVGGFGGKADMLNNYFIRTGNPDYFNEDLSRHRAIDTADLSAAAVKFLRDDARLVMSVVPEGKRELAAEKRGGVR